MLRGMPYENETTIVVAVGRSKTSSTTPALNGQRQEYSMFADYAFEQRIDQGDLLAVHLGWDASQIHSVFPAQRRVMFCPP